MLVDHRVGIGTYYQESLSLKVDWKTNLEDHRCFQQKSNLEDLSNETCTIHSSYAHSVRELQHLHTFSLHNLRNFGSQTDKQAGLKHRLPSLIGETADFRVNLSRPRFTQNQLCPP